MSDPKAPDVTMLWEPDDPHVALRERFGFAGVEAAAQWLATTLEKHWEVRLFSCERLVISGGNVLAWASTDQGGLIAKWSVVSKLFPRLAELARLTAWLHGRGLPVVGPLPARDGSHQVEVDGLSMGLQPQIAGELLDVTDVDRVREVGAVLARLHLTMADYPDVERIRAVSEDGGTGTMQARLTRWLDSAGGRHPSAALASFRERLWAVRAQGELPVQLVHMDVRSANVLCADSGLEALLDFELATLDHCVMDLAKGAAMLGTQFRSWGPVPPETHQVLVAGYRSVRPLSPTEEAWLPLLILWHTLQAVPAGDDPAGWGRSFEQQLAIR